MESPQEILKDYNRRRDHEKEQILKNYQNRIREERHDKQRETQENHNRIRTRDPMGFLIRKIIELVSDNDIVHKQLNKCIEKEGETVLLYTTGSSSAVFKYTFHEECGYKHHYEFIDDLMTQSKHTFNKTVIVKKGPYSGWKISFGQHKQTVGSFIGPHGVGGGSWYEYTVELYYPSSCIIV